MRMPQKWQYTTFSRLHHVCLLVRAIDNCQESGERRVPALHGEERDEVAVEVKRGESPIL